MTWVKLDEGFAEHPKVVMAGAMALAMQVAGLCYCNRNSTGGVLSRSAARTLLDWEGVEADGEPVTAARVIDALLASGMWEHHADGGYEIHDYGDYQPLRADLDAVRRQKSDAGKKGAAARWHGTRDDTRHDGTDDTRDDTPMAGAIAGAMAERCPVPVPEVQEIPPGGEVPPPSLVIVDGSTPSTVVDEKPFARDFDEWWHVYPRKIEKAAAMKTYQARRRSGNAAGELLLAAKNYAKEVAGSSLEYVKHGSSFLAADDGPWSERLSGPCSSHGRVAVARNGPEDW